MSFPTRRPAAASRHGIPATSPGAEALAKKTIAEFEGFDYVVVPSGSCGDHIRTEYLGMFATEPEWRDRATAMAARTYELTDFLVSVLKVEAVPGTTRAA